MIAVHWMLRTILYKTLSSRVLWGKRETCKVPAEKTNPLTFPKRLPAATAPAYELFGDITMEIVFGSSIPFSPATVNMLQSIVSIWTLYIRKQSQEGTNLRLIFTDELNKIVIVFSLKGADDDWKAAARTWAVHIWERSMHWAGNRNKFACRSAAGPMHYHRPAVLSNTFFNAHLHRWLHISCRCIRQHRCRLAHRLRYQIWRPDSKR